MCIAIVVVCDSAGFVRICLLPLCWVAMLMVLLVLYIRTAFGSTRHQMDTKHVRPRHAQASTHLISLYLSTPPRCQLVIMVIPLYFPAGPSPGGLHGAADGRQTRAARHYVPSSEAAPPHPPGEPHRGTSWRGDCRQERAGRQTLADRVLGVCSDRPIF